MTWVKRWDSEFVYGIIVLIAGLSYIFLKEFYFEYRLISFGLVMGIFFVYVFEQLNTKWEDD